MKKYYFALFFAASMMTACSGKGGNPNEPNDSHLQPFEVEFNFGTVKDGAGFEFHDFHFRNDGKDPLVISKIETYCHCTAVKYPQEPIKPGEEGVINLRLDCGDVSPGFFSRDIDVYYNGKGSPVRLTVSGKKEEMQE